MKNLNGIKSLGLRALKDESGQSVAFLAFVLVLFFGFTGLAVDIGNAVVCQHLLQSATDAAALAGTSALRQGTADAAAKHYSASTTYGGINAYPILSQVSGSPVEFDDAVTCVNNVPKMVSCNPDYPNNSIKVHEQATVPTYFIRMLSIFGVHSVQTLTLNAYAQGGETGVVLQPMNIAIVLDTTASMNTTDTTCGHTRIQCAEQAVSAFLYGLTPCDTAIANPCTLTNGSVDRVSIFTFPNVDVGTAVDDTNCGNSTPNIPVYSTPAIPASGSTTQYNPPGTSNSTATYQITPFDIDYSNATGLVMNSALAQATGDWNKAGTTSGCRGMASPGGDGTYYAGVIYAVQQQLMWAASQYPSTSPLPPAGNVMLILTDGDATAAANKITGSPTTVWPGGNNPTGGSTSTISNYPSAVDQCQQAVAAANYAKSLGTTIYAVAYGSPTSGCATDTSGPQKNIQPCTTIQEMSGPGAGNAPNFGAPYFYSDYNQSGTVSTCVAAGTSSTSLSGILADIGQGVMKARLIPYGTT